MLVEKQNGIILSLNTMNIKSNWRENYQKNLDLWNSVQKQQTVMIKNLSKEYKPIGEEKKKIS